MVGCELEEGAVAEDAVALKGDFPFQGGPPRVQHSSHSPGLGRLLEAIEDSQGSLSTAEHNSLVKVGALALRRARAGTECVSCKLCVHILRE